MLTRKHFKAIAYCIYAEYTRFDGTGEDDTEGKEAIKNIVMRLANYFETENSRFDRERFLKACGL